MEKNNFMQHKKKIGKFILLEENICDLDCDCGWNLQIGGKDKADLDTIKNYLEYGEDIVDAMQKRVQAYFKDVLDGAPCPDFTYKPNKK